MMGLKKQGVCNGSIEERRMEGKRGGGENGVEGEGREGKCWPPTFIPVDVSVAAPAYFYGVRSTVSRLG